MKTTLLSLSLLLGPAGASTAPPAPPAGELLRPGVFHGEEVSASSGPAWLCFTSVDGGTALTPCAVEVTRAYDPIVDAETGKRVSAPGVPGVVAMLRGFPDLAAGPVPTLFLGTFPLEPGASISLGPPGETVTFWVRESGAGHELVYGGGERVRVVTVLPRIDREGPPALLWVGDLDGDGALDILADTTDHFNVSRWSLFVSGGDRDGPPTLVTRFTSTGC